MSSYKFQLKKNPGLTLFITLDLLFLVNAIVILLANYFFPNHVVLGTGHITKFWAILHAVFTLSFINAFAVPVIREIEKYKGRMLKSSEWMVKYLVLNFVSLWVIARFAEQLGLGLSSWLVALVLAAVLDVAQGMAMMWFEKIRLNS